MDPEANHRALQRKVQFDIRFFFCRRGSENVEQMKIADFNINFNSKNETWYVHKIKDELTKNHKEAENIISGLMPENKDDRLCPVASFRKYLQHIEPKNPYLWQTPLKSGKKKGDPNIWYGLQHMGKNTLSGFMKDVSKECGLSTMYTNHSIRVTGITVLTRQNFTNSEIMAVSGHKSVQSLVNYQKTRDVQKLEMGSVLFQSMTKSEEEIQRTPLKELPSPPMRHALPATKNVPALMFESETAVTPANKKQRVNPPEEHLNKQIVPFEPNFDEESVSDIDLISALCQVEAQTNPEPPTSAAVANTVMNNLPTAMFANCSNLTIGTINFNISK